MAYAQALSKQDLINWGIEEVKEDGTVIKNGKQLDIIHSGHDRQVPYLKVNIYDSINKKAHLIGLHRLLYVWYIGDIPEGYVVDHINNKHGSLEDYKLSNLQLLTSEDNILKDKRPLTYKVKMAKRGYTRQEIIDKIEYYTDLKDKARAAKDYQEGYHFSIQLSQWKSKLMQFDENPELHSKKYSYVELF